MARRVRIVVGEGRAAQQGLLRFVLEGEGFDVVGEARGTADLTDVIESNEPDVVVLDDGIGVIAVSMVHDVAPQAKVVLVWPSAVVPIGGDARVEPARILRDLGAAVDQVMAPAAALTETFERPGWVDKVRKDPTALREKLSGKETTKGPSVTRLQRRSKRLHPTGSRLAPAERDRDEQVPAPVVVLPVGVGGADLEPVLDIGGGVVGTESGDAPVEERSEWNRRLGTLALSGAAAVSALVLALALGGGRVPVSVIRGGGQVPVGVPGIVQSGQTVLGPYGSGTLGGSGYDPTVVNEPSGPDKTDKNGGQPAGEDTSPGGGLAAPDGSGVRDEPPPVVDPGVDEGPGGDGDGGGNGGGNGGGGNGGGGNGGGGNGGGGNGGGGNGGGGNGGGGNGGRPGSKPGSKHKSDPPGQSGEHNPHGGPPGHMGNTPAHGPGLGVGSSVEHGSDRHPHKN